jgi:hypothetical protein
MSDLDRIKGGWATFVRSLLPRLDYQALYPARVVKQNADGTLELIADNPKLGRTLSAIQLRRRTPGEIVKVAPGSRVLLGFEEGDPRKPVALLFELGSGGLVEVQTLASSKAVLGAPDVRLGAAGASHPIPRGDDLALLLAHGFDTVRTAAVGPLAPLQAGLAELIVAMGYVPTLVPAPGGGVQALSGVSKTE